MHREQVGLLKTALQRKLKANDLTAVQSAELIQQLENLTAAETACVRTFAGGQNEKRRIKRLEKEIESARAMV